MFKSILKLKINKDKRNKLIQMIYEMKIHILKLNIRNKRMKDSLFLKVNRLLYDIVYKKE